MVVMSRRQGPPKQATVLVIEDEVRSQRLLRMNLEPLGYRVITLETATNGAELLARYDPEIIIVDLKLPGADGFDLCREVRTLSSVPIIIVSGSVHAHDKVHGLELGADDYVTKPYDPAELAARIGAVLRRVQGLPPLASECFRTGELEIDFSQRQVRMAGREIALTGTEYRLLEHLARNAGRTLVADALIAKVWGEDYASAYASLHLYISRLRRKLGESSHQTRYILTKSGIGYQLVPPEDNADSGRMEIAVGAGASTLAIRSESRVAIEYRA